MNYFDEEYFDVEKYDNPGELFLDIAQFGEINRVMDMIEQGIDVNYQDDTNETALYVASENGQIDIVKILLENGANPNLQENVHGETPLMVATKIGRIDIMKILLENGANPLIKDYEGNTPYDEVESINRIPDLEYDHQGEELLKYYTMMYKMQRKSRKNLTYKKKKTQLAYKNLALSKLLDTYDVDEPLIREMRRTNVSSIFGEQSGSGKRKTKKYRGGKKPCWDNYKMDGMKPKNGKMVPNCVYNKKGGKRN